MSGFTSNALLKSPCNFCDWKGDRNCDKCAFCQPKEEYLALLENRPAVDLADRQAKEVILRQQLMAGVTKSHQGNRTPRIKWTEEMMRIALEARERGMSLDDTARLVGVGRKCVARRFKDAGVPTFR